MAHSHQHFWHLTRFIVCTGIIAFWITLSEVSERRERSIHSDRALQKHFSFNERGLVTARFIVLVNDLSNSD